MHDAGRVISCIGDKITAPRNEIQELYGHLLAAVVEEQAEADGEIKDEAQDVALQGGAKTHGGLEVSEALQQSAAGLLGRRAERYVEQATENIGADAELERVPGALGPGAGARRRGRLPWWRIRAMLGWLVVALVWRFDAAVPAGSDEVDEE
ncbi:hypothetical protein BHE74_00052857 [Ensete ventricosum]|nr:hypothetical protein BHE74_00052857 [Ensete ventricosum]